jgi:acetolactate synthase-1/2/3 large subunit
MKVSDYILTFLRDKGVNHVFHVTGGACMHLTDSFNNILGIEPICCHNEQAASMSAEAYARYNGNLGACIVTSGPGASNAITGCLSAWIDSIPVFFISGQYHPDGKLNYEICKADNECR